MKIQVNYAPVDSVSIQYYFDSKAIYCLISLCNFMNNKEASRLANSPELGVSQVKAENKTVIFNFSNSRMTKQRTKLTMPGV